MKYNFKIKPCYTWKDEYNLPYESKWSKRAKFCFLNGLNWSLFDRNKNIKQLVDINSNQFFDNFPQELVQNLSQNIRICPKCIKYGYHSDIHQLPELRTCFIHKNSSLITIDKQKEEQSKSGTYEFADIKIEDIISNNYKCELDNYFKSREQIAPKYIKIIYPKKEYTKLGRIKLYNSTINIIQKLYFLNNNVSTSKCKKILSINIDNIHDENYNIAENIINSIVETKENTFKDSMKRIILSNKTKIPNTIYPEPLGLCFVKVIYDTINKYFDDINDWENYINVIINANIVNIKELNLLKFAYVIATLSITSVYSIDACYMIDSRKWIKAGYKCNFGIDLFSQLCLYEHPIRWDDKQYQKFASQIIVYPILEDVFHYIANNIYAKLKNKIVSTKTMISNNKSVKKYIKTPQYIVLYWLDRLEIYRCDK